MARPGKSLVAADGAATLICVPAAVRAVTHTGSPEPTFPRGVPR
jgi:hypothetical protein